MDFDFIDAPKNIKISSPLASSTIDLSVEDFSLKDQGTEWFENEYNGIFNIFNAFSFIDRSYSGDGDDYLTSWFVLNN